jgi:hypothetical protein
MSETKKIYEQFKIAQSEFKTVLKDSVNPFFKSKYASLSSVLEAVLGPLSKNGLSLSQSVEDGNMITIIMNNEGDTIMSKSPFIIPKVIKEVGKGNFVLIDETDPQAIGKVETYARRYGLQLALGLTAEDDDSQTPAAKPQTPAPAKTASAPKPQTPAPAGKLTFEDIKNTEDVFLTELDTEYIVSGKTYSLSAGLKSLGFVWDGKDKVWKKAKQAQAA